MKTLTLEQKLDIVSNSITLNGKPAIIIGAKSDYATVIALDGSERYQWNWVTAARIVENGGNFKARVD
jgi:hypothetical protein